MVEMPVLVYMEAHPVVIDALFASVIAGTFAIGSRKVYKSVDNMRKDILRAIESRNDLLRDGFSALANLLSNRPCLQPKKKVEDLPDDDPIKEEANGRNS